MRSMRVVCRKHSRGYTAVEVMMAMGLLGLGTAGVLSSLKTVTIGATGVRDFDTATNLAQSWVERVRTDATAWISETTFGNASLLASGFTGNAFLPTQAYGTETVQAGSDLRGTDLPPTHLNTKFCAGLRFRCLATSGAAAPGCASIVVTVAVFFPREGATVADTPFCTVNNALTAIPAAGADRSAAFDSTFRTVTISTVVGPTLQ